MNTLIFKYDYMIPIEKVKKVKKGRREGKKEQRQLDQYFGQFILNSNPCTRNFATYNVKAKQNTKPRAHKYHHISASHEE